MIRVETLRPRTGAVVPLPIVPEDGLYLWDWGICDSGTEECYLTPSRIVKKLISGFQATWAKIPERDRDKLTDFWHSRLPPRPGYDSKPSPAIELNSLCLKPRYVAACRGGRELLFSVDFLDRAKRPAICNTIAHELAHAISHAHGWFQQHDCTAHLGECLACECRAHSYMAAWGFDPFEDVLPKVKSGLLIDRLAERLT